MMQRSGTVDPGPLMRVSACFDRFPPKDPGQPDTIFLYGSRRENAQKSSKIISYI